MDAATRELIVDYIAQCEAEDWAADCRVPYAYAYAVVRKAGDGIESWSDQRLLRFYVERFDLDPTEHQMDLYVTGLVLNFALTGDV